MYHVQISTCVEALEFLSKACNVGAVYSSDCTYIQQMACNLDSIINLAYLSLYINNVNYSQ